jgi:hypothetical protein
VPSTLFATLSFLYSRRGGVAKPTGTREGGGASPLGGRSLFVMIPTQSTSSCFGVISYTLGLWCQVTPSTTDGEVTVQLGVTKVYDLATNDNTASNVMTFEYDGVAPTATLTMTQDRYEPRQPWDMTVTFSELINGFVEADLTVTGAATISNFVATNVDLVRCTVIRLVGGLLVFGLGRQGHKWALNEAQRPLSLGIRAALGTGYSRGVGNRRAGERRREFVSLKLSLSLSLSTLSLSLSRSLASSLYCSLHRSLARLTISLSPSPGWRWARHLPDSAQLGRIRRERTSAGA